MFNDIVDSWSVPKGLSKEEAWDKLQSRIQVEENRTIVVPMWKKLLPAVGAAACLVLAIWVFQNNDDIQTISSENTRMEHTLPDGSMVFVNKDSEISYDVSEWSVNRELTLKGEAYFEVVKGSQFTVHTDLGDVSVLGTSFNIFSRENYFDVNCFTGKVAVVSNSKEVLLTQGLATCVEGIELQDSFSFKGQLPDWKNHEFRFEHIELKRVFEEIESEFDVSIEYNSGEILFFTGVFEISSLQRVLEAVCLSMELEFEINGNQVVIS